MLFLFTSFAGLQRLKIIVIAVITKRKNKMTYFNKEENHLIDSVRVALRTWYLREPQGTLPPKTQWPNTRDVAECCNISIYIARYYLLKLVEKKEAYMTSCTEKKILRWHIAEPKLFSKKGSRKGKLLVVK